MGERSLSPMELDSVSSSPITSPDSTPKTTPPKLEPITIPPRSPASSIASSSGFQDLPAEPPAYINGVKEPVPRTSVSSEQGENEYQGSVPSDRPSTSVQGKPEANAQASNTSHTLNHSVNGKAGPKKPVYNPFVPAKHATGPSASMEAKAPENTDIFSTTQKVSKCLDFYVHTFKLFPIA